MAVKLEVLPLTHPHQIEGMGGHSKKRKQIHLEWTRGWSFVPALLCEQIQRLLVRMLDMLASRWRFPI